MVLTVLNPRFVTPAAYARAALSYNRAYTVGDTSMTAALPQTSAQPLPLHTLNPDQWQRAKPLLDDNWIQAEPTLAKV